MGTPVQIPTPGQAPNQGQPGWPQRFGNVSQILTGIVAVVALLLSGVTLYLRHQEQDAKVADDHTNVLIAAKLDPEIAKINDGIDKKLGPINKSLEDLNGKVNDAVGQLKRLKGDVNEQAQKQQQLLALNRIPDPKRILGNIRTEIQTAETGKTVLPDSKLADYKTALHVLSPSVSDYWTTLATIINYQSFVNQMKGEAPDPNKVSRWCPILTAGIGNVVEGGEYPNCIVDLDTQVFIGVTFRNSVIRYHGQPTSLRNVQFVNCSFKLDLPPSSPTPPQQDLLFALLDSHDQKTVRVN